MPMSIVISVIVQQIYLLQSDKNRGKANALLKESYLLV